MKHVKGLLILTVAIPFSAMSFAHDTWLVANPTTVPPGTTVQLDLTSGMEFPSLDHAIDPDRVDKALCRLAGKAVEMTQQSARPHSFRLDAHLAVSGIATLWVDLKPRSIELTPKQVQEYLNEIGAPEEVRSAWANSMGPKRWREIYSKHSKTFVRVGQAETDHSWAEAVGAALEIVPEKDPTTLRVGDELPVRLMRRGNPAPHLQVGVVHEGDAAADVRVTDTDGRAVFRLDRSGRWLLRATELRQSPKDKVDWESHFATLTIEVSSG